MNPVSPPEPYAAATSTVSAFTCPNSALLPLTKIKSKTLSFGPTKISTNASSPISLSSVFSTLAHKNQNTKLKSLLPIRSSSSVGDISAVDAVPSKSPSVKSRLHNGETLYGIFLCSFCPTIAEIAGLAGYDFAVVDMEHGYGGISDALQCLRALAATQTPAILRLPESSATWAKKALDLGPQGVMFPMIDGPKSAKKAVSYCRYPPNGVRGAAHPIVRASGYGIDAGYLGNFEENLLIMCQVESVEAVEKIEEIAAVEGVDCIQMGPLDLSASMGYLWDPGNKKVREMIRAAETAILRPPNNKNGSSGGSGGDGRAYLSGFAMPFDTPRDLKARGYHMVSGAVDVGLFSNAAIENVKRFKMCLTGDGSDDEEEGEKDGDEKYWSE
ncbi:hypothetical protein Nepgr_031618 [Nepenthes gracilis]|uniref:HpcH/HpaI aldolase/citrate lyase domain-containing protein n=1 Tax=Nepenthes gracilis TaxID=150966 RepID=A0AAD3Y706_NEPGR|nr:hypothetical protein Nepgr_031618 [Nepenthes gracilis]